MSSVLAQILSESIRLAEGAKLHREACPLAGETPDFKRAFAADCICGPASTLLEAATLPQLPAVVRGQEYLRPGARLRLHSDPALFEAIRERNRMREQLEAAQRAVEAMVTEAREREQDLRLAQAELLQAKAALAGIILRKQ